jgi:hypothetical protein
VFVVSSGTLPWTTFIAALYHGVRRRFPTLSFSLHFIGYYSLTGDCYLYDINQVCARQEERTGQGTPYRKLAASEGGAVSELVFLQKGKRLVLCQNDLLYCWSIGVGARMPLLLWKFRWKAISSIVPLGRDALVLGSKQGHLALLNWKKMQRAAFSSEPMHKRVGFVQGTV